MAIEEGLIEPGETDRGIVIGQTGSGKSFFMRHLLLDFPRIMALDPKGTLGGEDASGGDWHLEDWDRRAKKAFKRGKDVRVRVPAPMNGNWSPVLWDFYNAGDAILYTDEMFGVVNPRKPMPTAMNAIYTRGRELGMGAWAASQRPSWIPLEIMSEAQWFVLFRVLLEKDRRRMAEVMGPEVIAPIQDEYGFWIYYVGWRNPVYYSGLEVE